MLTRILSALVLIPLVLLVAYRCSPLAFALVVTGVGTLCFHEFQGMGRERMGASGGWALTVVAAAAGFFAVYPAFPDHRSVSAAAFFLVAGALAVARGRGPGEALGRLAWPAVGFLYIFVLFSWLYDIRFGLSTDRGPLLLVLFFLVQWLGDSFAYLSGRLFGRHKLCEAVSPKKTVEGTLGGLLGSAGAGVAVALAGFPERAWWPFAAAAVFLGAAGQVGDLMESLFKRCCGVKDSSGLIPGHGGMLDRIDSLLFTAPVFYFLMGMVLKHA
ncbi:MAG: phosphatidate cytidylyltransferase [Acidobacteria bacterium]|nr:phosphatidate cytidylyltransferase [Acidobacteriota bacterium]